jgi:L-alanine-DL-glutamate epimerase-like enolase superfamily enzyme
MAEALGIPCTPHSANLSLVTLFTLHLVAALPNAGPFVEFSIEPNRWTEGLYDPPLVVQNGEVAIPSGPGWGVTINPQWLEGAEYRISERQ